MIKLALVGLLFVGSWFVVNTYLPATMWQSGFHVAGHLVSWSMVVLGAVVAFGWKKIK